MEWRQALEGRFFLVAVVGGRNPIRLERVSDSVNYQLGWTTLPGLRGLSVTEFRAMPTSAPDTVPDGRFAADERDVAIEFASGVERDEFLRRIEAQFAARRFTNTADAFDTVKAYVLEHAAKKF